MINLTPVVFNMKSFSLIFFALLFHYVAAEGQIQVIKSNPGQAVAVNGQPAADSVASYKGGNQALFAFLEQQFFTGDSLAEKKKGLNYAATVSFIVDSSGKCSDLHLDDLRDAGLPLTPVIKAELIRVLGHMPEWKPGFKNGKYVSSMVFLPLAFSVMNGKMIILKDEQAAGKRKLGKEKWAIIIASVVLIAAIAFFGIR